MHIIQCMVVFHSIYFIAVPESVVFESFKGEIPEMHRT